ncbi:MAG TPA: hypothetical protein VLX44_02445, partial [Xanthobacteraceae bacterium]|nr:hypothetical protein [Xanthobacteraceae bacterium]
MFGKRSAAGGDARSPSAAPAPLTPAPSPAPAPAGSDDGGRTAFPSAGLAAPLVPAPVPQAGRVAGAAAPAAQPAAAAIDTRRSDTYYEVKGTIFGALIEAIDLTQLAKLDADSAREEIRDIVNEIIAIKNIVMSISEQEELLDDICN